MGYKPGSPPKAFSVGLLLRPPVGVQGVPPHPDRATYFTEMFDVHSEGKEGLTTFPAGREVYLAEVTSSPAKGRNYIKNAALCRVFTC